MLFDCYAHVKLYSYRICCLGMLISIIVVIGNSTVSSLLLLSFIVTGLILFNFCIPVIDFYIDSIINFYFSIIILWAIYSCNSYFTYTYTYTYTYISAITHVSFSITAVIFNNHVVMYVSWLGINVNNIYGFFLFMLFIVQIITGILLSFYYSSSSYISFESVYYLSFNVLYGFIIRFIHVIGSFLCIYFLYMHLLRSLWYTINFQLTSTFLYTYSSGLVILFLSLLVSFLGYCLCWGQMSYWGIQVLINILTILPAPFSYILPELIYSSSLLILYRFFVLHFLLSLIILLLIVFHLFVLHSFISSNTFINLSSSLSISFYLFIFKDFYYFFIFYFLFLTFIFFYNFEFLSNPVNLIHSSSLSTPLHILPESYYLIFYSLLRALPSKLFGIIVVIIFMFYLLFL